MQQQDPADALPERLGQYSIAGRLATGGMAEILLGRRTGPSGFERAVVIKRILPHLARQPSFVAMFLDEARIAALIHHPNVVQVEELAQAGSELFIVMEYLDGESCSQLLKRLAQRKERLPAWLAAHVVAEAAAGLAAAHELTDAQGRRQQLVHRDVSPDNLFITHSGSVKLIDFGIARVRDRLSFTQTGLVKGKLAYMSPEQLNGEEIDPRSDLFSLGVVLHELLTGRRLFLRENDGATVKAICEGSIALPSSVAEECPAQLDAICARALARQREGRYQTALELRGELRAAAQSLAPQALPDESLKTLMAALFADRAGLRTALMHRLRSGASMPRSLAAPAPSRATRRAVLAVTGIVLLGLAGLGWVLLAPKPDTLAPPPEPAPAPQLSPPAAPASVRIVISSTPPGAAVSIDGDVRGETPLELELPRDSEPKRLELQLVGHQPLTRVLKPAADQELQLVLQRIAPPVASPPKRSAPKPKPGIHRFD